MTDYKLVPVEPTQEMVEAGEYALEADCYASGIYADMLAAAPVVQGEPVGWQYYQHGEWRNGDESIKGHRKNTEEAGFRVRDVYAAPQPPLQLPDFATDPDDSDEVASLWDHGFKRGWNSCLGAVAKAMQLAEQQPAPDVEGLVEALETCLEMEERPKIIKLAREALAAHRKGGGQ